MSDTLNTFTTGSRSPSTLLRLDIILQEDQNKMTSSGYYKHPSAPQNIEYKSTGIRSFKLESHAFFSAAPGKSPLRAIDATLQKRGIPYLQGLLKKKVVNEHKCKAYCEVTRFGF